MPVSSRKPLTVNGLVAVIRLTILATSLSCLAGSNDDSPQNEQACFNQFIHPALQIVPGNIEALS